LPGFPSSGAFVKCVNDVSEYTSYPKNRPYSFTYINNLPKREGWYWSQS